MGWVALKNDRNLVLLALSFLNAFLFTFITDSKNSIKNLFITLYFFMCLIPSQIFLHGGDLGIFKLIYLNLILYIFPIISFLFRQMSVKQISSLNIKLLLIILMISSVIIIFAISPPKLSIFSISSFVDLYDIRMQSRGELSQANSVVKYLYMLTFKVFAPLLFAYFLLRQKYLFASAVGIVFFLGFMASGHKSLFLTPFVMITLYQFLQFNYTFQKTLPIVFVTLSILSLFSFGLVQFLIGEVLFRRIVIMPGMLTTMYFDHFSSTGFNYFGSLVSRITGSQSIPLPFIIGEAMFGRPQMSANANFVASGFAEFGVMGVFLYSVVINLSFYFVSAKDNFKNTVYLVALTPILLAMLETNLTTVLLTHGLFFMIIFCSIGRIR
ncbi:MAG: hypothetical protein P8H57_00035 [Emcibacteraceae bacterium]|nr:hypothetical protein [Emcibacteraceae bacterium]